MFYPKSNDIPTHLRAVIDDVFIKNQNSIDSSINQYSSNEILEILRTSVESLGYLIEKDKTSEGKIKVPVLFGLNGSYDKSFDADGYHKELKTVVEVEAGRGVTNYQFLKDLFQACVMHGSATFIYAIFIRSPLIICILLVSCNLVNHEHVYCYTITHIPQALF